MVQDISDADVAGTEGFDLSPRDAWGLIKASGYYGYHIHCGGIITWAQS